LAKVLILEQIYVTCFRNLITVTRSADAIYETPVLTIHTSRGKIFDLYVNPSRDVIIKWFKNFLK